MIEPDARLAFVHIVALHAVVFEQRLDCAGKGIVVGRQQRGPEQIPTESNQRQPQEETDPVSRHGKGLGRRGETRGGRADGSLQRFYQPPGIPGKCAGWGVTFGAIFRPDDSACG
ncbi:MAG: hypothetical protein ACK55Z_20310, partial [bacterium]